MLWGQLLPRPQLESPHASVNSHVLQLRPRQSAKSLSHVWLFVTPMDCSTPGFHVHHRLLDLAHIHVHWVGGAIQPSDPLTSPSPHPPPLKEMLKELKEDVVCRKSRKWWVGEFSASPVAKILHFHCQSQISILGWGIKISQAMWSPPNTKPNQNTKFDKEMGISI